MTSKEFKPKEPPFEIYKDELDSINRGLKGLNKGKCIPTRLSVKSTNDIYQIRKVLDGVSERFPDVRKTIPILKYLICSNQNIFLTWKS
jgi:hypothetical protein